MCLLLRETGLNKYGKNIDFPTQICLMDKWRILNASIEGVTKEELERSPWGLFFDGVKYDLGIVIGTGV